MTATDRAARIARVTRWVWQSTATRPDRIQRVTEAPEMDEARDLSALYPSGTDEEKTARDNDLHGQAHAGDEAATLALYGQYMGLVERLAATHGTMAARRNRNVVFDQDDAHQEAALTLLEIVEDGPNRKDFAGRFAFEANHSVYYEAWRHIPDLSVTWDVAKDVQRAVELFNGDLSAASNYLATVPPVRNRVSRDRFFSVLAAIDPSKFVQLDAPIGEGQTPVSDTLADPRAAEAFARVLGLDEFDNEFLAAAWRSLTDREREVIALLVGMNDVPMTQGAVAELLGTTQPAVSQTASRAMAKLRDALNVSKAPKSVGPKAPSTTRRTKEETPEFEVHVRQIGEPAPDLSREGINRGGLSIR